MKMLVDGANLHDTTDVKLTLHFIIQTISDPVNLGNHLNFPVEQKNWFAGTEQELRGE
jgi:hypothetical protein